MTGAVLTALPADAPRSAPLGPTARGGAALGAAAPAHPGDARDLRAGARAHRGRCRRRRPQRRRGRWPHQRGGRQRAGAPGRGDDTDLGAAAAPCRRDGGGRCDRGRGGAGHAARAVDRPGGTASAGHDEGVRRTRRRHARDAGPRGRRRGGRAGRGRRGGRSTRHALRHHRRHRGGAGQGGPRGRLDGRAARGGGRDRAGDLVVHRAPARRDGVGARRTDRLRGPRGDPRPGLAAALPAHQRLERRAPTPCATPSRSATWCGARCVPSATSRSAPV